MRLKSSTAFESQEPQRKTEVPSGWMNCPLLASPALFLKQLQDSFGGSSLGTLPTCVLCRDMTKDMSPTPRHKTTFPAKNTTI